MAGEFAVLERLYRAGHQPALTLGNAKNIDILSKASTGRIFQISVKAITGGGKWPIGKADYSHEQNLVFVLLHYTAFNNVSVAPHIWVLPATAVMELRRPWFDGFGIYSMNKAYQRQLEPYRDRWDLLDAELAGPAYVPDPAWVSPTVLVPGGTLAKVLATLEGFQEKHLVWPSGLSMGAKDLEVLRRHHLTSDGWASLTDKLAISEGETEHVVATGLTGLKFVHGIDQPASEKPKGRAFAWIGFV
ncbi:hypothetical protein ACSFA0_25000 [Variovorax sp. LT1P1]|uniref:hypothetical protein n=1 Tax=Variovorax sp. LT1P1 TaxID=3443730 RepID=UPI003F478116